MVIGMCTLPHLCAPPINLKKKFDVFNQLIPELAVRSLARIHETRYKRAQGLFLSLHW